jgi:hypothetical protein
MVVSISGLFWAAVGFVLGALEPAGPTASVQRLTVAQWFQRAISGLLLGFIWASLVSFAWIGLAAAVYGGFDKALQEMKPSRWLWAALAGYYVSVPASFIGGLVGPLALGSLSTRVRQPVVSSSACGAGISAALGIIVGPWTGWFLWEYDPTSLVYIGVALGLSLPVGFLGGWLGGRALAAA